MPIFIQIPTVLVVWNLNRKKHSNYLFLVWYNTSGIQTTVLFFFFFLLSVLLRELGSLCWDRGFGAFESTLDAALLGSSRAGTDHYSNYRKGFRNFHWLTANV